MNASRTDHARMLDWSAVKGDAPRNCQVQILRLLVRRSSKGPAELSQREICSWLNGTPKAFVVAQLGDMVANGLVRVARNGLSRRAGLVYSPVTVPTTGDQS